MSEPSSLHVRPSPLLDPEAEGGGHLNDLFARLPRDRLRALSRRLTGGALERGVWIEVDGAKRALPFALRPRLLDLRGRGYVHHVTWQLRMALRRLSRVLRDDPRAREILPLGADERRWIAQYARPGGAPGSARGERIFCRLDALGRFDGPGWPETLRFVEPNVVGVGGMRYITAAESLVLETLGPLLEDLDDELAFDRNTDPRELLLEELLDHARALGVRSPPVLAFVDDKTLYRHGGELGQIVPWAVGRGLDAIYADPRELRLARDGRVVAQGRAVDVVYRNLEIRDLAELEAKGEDLSGMRAAFAAGIVVPTAGGDLEHKSTFDVLTDDRFRDHFTDAMQQVIDRHVLWTRLLFERRTGGPDRGLVDLVPWARRHRARLVLKPNRASGGEGVILGETVDDAAWARALERALEAPGSHVVQERAPPEVELFPVIDAWPL